MKNSNHLLLAIIIPLLTVNFSYSQDGESMYKSKCASCHDLKKNSTGPLLQGVQSKWENAGESRMLYRWVKNSKSLIQSGESKLAIEIQDFNVVTMPVQDVTNQEIDAIFDYIQDYHGPNPKDTVDIVFKGKLTDAELQGYSDRLELFYLLLVTNVFALLVIIGISKTIKTILVLSFFENRPQGLYRNNVRSVATSFLVLIFCSAIGSSHALSPTVLVKESGELPWLLIEWWEIWLLIALNALLVWLILYLRSVFDSAMRFAYENAE